MKTVIKKAAVAAICLGSSFAGTLNANDVRNSEGFNGNAMHCCAESECELEGEIIIKVGFGYGVKIEFYPDTPEDIIDLVADKAQQVVNDPEVQKKAAEIYVSKGARSAALYIMKEIAGEVGSEFVVSISLVPVRNCIDLGEL